MGTVGDHALGAVIFECFGGVTQSPGSVHHVVNQQTGTVVNVTNNIHDFGNAGLGTTFVDDGQINAQLFCYGAGANHTADVRRYHDQILKVLTFDVFKQHRWAVNVIHGNVEEALDLFSGQVNGQHPVYTDTHHHVCDDFSGYGEPG